MLDDKDLWLLQVEIDVYTLLKKVNDVKMWSVCTVSVLDDKDLWLLQVEIDVYTLLKKVNDVELWSVYS